MQIFVRDTTSLCLTSSCISLALTLLDNMNLDANMCGDFYEYICGNFELEHPILDDRSLIGSFDLLSDANNLELGCILENDESVSSNVSLCVYVYLIWYKLSCFVGYNFLLKNRLVFKTRRALFGAFLYSRKQTKFLPILY